MAPPGSERAWSELPRSILADLTAAAGRPLLSALDRCGTGRAQAEYLARALGAAQARVLVVFDVLSVRVRERGGLEWLSRDEVVATYGASPDELRFLGSDENGSPLFSYEVEEATGEATSLREVLGRLDDLEAAAALEAVALANWHRRHAYCPACGGVTEVLEAGHSRSCPSCALRHFPRTDPAVIMLVGDGDGRCVLGRRVGAPEGRWSTLAGYVDAGESAEQAVAREVQEEVGLVVDTVRYRGSQPWPFSGSLMLSYSARARFGPLTNDHEHLEVTWFSREELASALAHGTMTIPPPIAAGHQLIRAFLDDTIEL